MNKLEQRGIAIPFGRFDMRHPKSISRWQPNEKLAMTADEQLMHNLKHGYLDEKYRIVMNEERIEFFTNQINIDSPPTLMQKMKRFLNSYGY